jgi:hypothetical protein
MNEQYFLSKIQPDLSAKNKGLKLKLPSQTGRTTYKKDFIKKDKIKTNPNFNLTNKFNTNTSGTSFGG